MCVCVCSMYVYCQITFGDILCVVVSHSVVLLLQSFHNHGKAIIEHVVEGNFRLHGC